MTEMIQPASATPIFQKDKLPTFEQMQSEVAILANQIWKDNGEPCDDGTPAWFEAERRLYGGLQNGGYRVFVSEDPEAKENQLSAVVVTPEGVLEEEDHTGKKAPKNSAGSGKKQVAQVAK